MNAQMHAIKIDNVNPDDVTPRYNLDTVAMIFELSTSVWTARKLDRKVSAEVVAGKHARSSGAARVNKNLLAGRDELDNITKFVNAVRQWIYSSTLPWSDTGQRIVPAAKVVEFDEKMKQYEADFWQLVDVFISIYPSLITAQAMALGDMFDRSEYPSAHEIRSKFGFSYDFFPIPESGDIRVDVGNAARKDLADRMSEAYQRRVEAAMKDLWSRLSEHIARMQDRLQVDVVQGEEKPRRFHETLVTSGLELCDILSTLNITNDTDLNVAAVELRAALKGVTAQDLRDDLNLREQTLKKVNDLADKLSF